MLQAVPEELPSRLRTPSAGAFQNPRLRPGPRRRAGGRADAAGNDRRHAGVHGARAGPRRGRGRARRPVQPRRGAVPRLHGAAAIPGRRRDLHADEVGHARAARSRPDRPGAAGGFFRSHYALAGEGPRPAAGLGGGGGAGAASIGGAPQPGEAGPTPPPMVPGRRRGGAVGRPDRRGRDGDPHPDRPGRLRRRDRRPGFLLPGPPRRGHAARSEGEPNVQPEGGGRRREDRRATTATGGGRRRPVVPGQDLDHQARRTGRAEGQGGTRATGGRSSAGGSGRGILAPLGRRAAARPSGAGGGRPPQGAKPAVQRSHVPHGTGRSGAVCEGSYRRRDRPVARAGLQCADGAGLPGGVARTELDWSVALRRLVAAERLQEPRRHRVFRHIGFRPLRAERQTAVPGGVRRDARVRPGAAARNAAEGIVVRRLPRKRPVAAARDAAGDAGDRQHACVGPVAAGGHEINLP